MFCKVDHSVDLQRLVRIRSYVIGLCVSERHARYGIVDSRGHIICSETVDIRKWEDPTSFVFDVCDRLMPMIEKCGGLENIQSMGICATSGNNLTGTIESPANLSWKGMIPLAKMFEGSLGVDVSLCNDALACAIGERAFGAAHGLQNFFSVIIDGGLGCGIIANNRPILGFNGRSGEIGHVAIFENGRSCGCGSTGCLESYCSRRGIEENTLERLAANPDVPSVLRDIPADKLTVHDVAAAAEKGDQLALDTLRYTGQLLGKALVPVVAFMNPEAIILCGWVGSLVGKYMQETILIEMNAGIMEQLKWQTQVLLTTLDPEEAPLLYASATAWDSKIKR